MYVDVCRPRHAVHSGEVLKQRSTIQEPKQIFMRPQALLLHVSMWEVLYQICRRPPLKGGGKVTSEDFWDPRTIQLNGVLSR